MKFIVVGVVAFIGGYLARRPNGRAITVSTVQFSSGDATWEADVTAIRLLDEDWSDSAGA
jgi:hypothetical protein